ncbi:MAG: amidohydrolase family protein [Gammaproteobacteria bacterium]|nr:amidohydrolase family protein [Gammaproteobacteria bacterium]
MALDPHAPYTVSDKPLIKIRDTSEKHHIGIHTHLNETAHEVNALPAYEALKLATINGATALGIDDEVRSVTIGKSADLINIDLSAPELQPLYNPVS